MYVKVVQQSTLSNCEILRSGKSVISNLFNIRAYQNESCGYFVTEELIGCLMESCLESLLSDVRTKILTCR